MRLLRTTGDALRTLHWTRGLRAGVAVAGAMIACHVFAGSIGWASGWAALGGFEAILVDNGGPYRSRFATIATLMAGGTIACVVASAGGTISLIAVAVSILATAAFCFTATLARTIAQAIASTSVIILVIYWAALGGSNHSLRHALWNALAFVLGCAWAGVLSLALWPVDPFRPARLAVAECYRMLAEFTASIVATERGSEEREQARRRAFDWQRRMRLQMELARAALAATAARAPSRTIRARNLTVLLETVDMLFAATLRLTELALGIEVDAAPGVARGVDPGVELVVDPLSGFVQRLANAERAIAGELFRKPKDGQGPDPLPSPMERVRSWPNDLVASEKGGRRAILAHLAAAEQDALQNIEIASEAVKAVWSGVESPVRSSQLKAARQAALDTISKASTPEWIDALRVNWTLDSVMMRHALRMTVVGVVDVALLRVLRLDHGFWLGMTSIIVLQPYPSHTLRRGIQRVGGTIAGGFLAALLAAAISSQAGVIAVVTATSVLTLATYAVDYAWYCFFLTPTFVLLSLPHLHDWRFSGQRMLTTLLGAAVAVGAMRFLWPEREHLAQGSGLARAAAADAAYIRATLRYWEVAGSQPVIEDRRVAEREILAPARRACGLASNDAEESLDRMMLDHRFGRLAPRPALQPSLMPETAASIPAQMKDHALTFVTYIRRLTQSVTTLAMVGRVDRESMAELQGLARRLDMLCVALSDRQPRPVATEEGAGPASEPEDDRDLARHQLQRMERQVSVLERAAAGVLGNSVAFGVGSSASAVRTSDLHGSRDC